MGCKVRKNKLFCDLFLAKFYINNVNLQSEQVDVLVLSTILLIPELLSLESLFCVKVYSMKNLLIVFACLFASFSAVAHGGKFVLGGDTVLVANDSLAVKNDTLVAVNDDPSVFADDTLSADTGFIAKGDSLSLTDADTLPKLAADSAVRSFFLMRLDSLVAHYDTLNVDMSNVDGAERTNPTFVRMFMRPTLYRSVLGKNYFSDISFSDNATDTQMAVDAKRSQVIDGLLLGLYKNNPSRVWATEDEIRKEASVENTKNQQVAGITMTAIQPIVMPENLKGELKTKVVKPNYWRTSGAFGVNYTQHFYSDNWRSGGENTKNMLVNMEFKLNYDDKKKIKFENHLEAKLGFYTAPSDTIHSVKTNQDLLRFTTKLGYKGWKDIYYSVKAQVWTQFMPYYDANKTDFRSNFMAPFNANFSFGIDYKPQISKGTLSVYLAPLSAYNYRFVRYGDLAVAHYGIRQGRHHYEDFGTILEVNSTLQLLKNFTWKSRLYYYTTYKRVEHDWENTLSFSFNKYISASMFIHTRFDDKARSQYSDDYGYWQLYHNMMLGLTYTW